MSKYIDTNALIRIIDAQMSTIECLKRIQDKEIQEGGKCQCTVHFDTKLETFNNVLETIDEMQGADVAPVVHATWVQFGNHFNYSCSRCGHNALQGMYNFCPNCGAKMGFDRIVVQKWDLIDLDMSEKENAENE